MNSTIYLFGKFGQSITTSVDDYTKNFFEDFISRANAPTQIIIHRDNDIMNYGYIRKIEKDSLFGVCVQINGQYLSSVKKLFEVFEKIIEVIATEGQILRLNRKGNIEAAIAKILDKPEVVKRVEDVCLKEFSKLTFNCRTLPEIDYSTIDSDINYFKEDDNCEKIVKASVKKGYTFIYKSQDYDTLQLADYRSTLSALNKENDINKKKINELEGKLRTLERKKKQMGVVVTLFIALFIGSVIFFNTIEEKNKDLVVKENTIDQQKMKNDILVEENNEIQRVNSDLQNDNYNLSVKYASTTNELETLNEQYDNLNRKYEALNKEKDRYKSEVNSLINRNRVWESKVGLLETELRDKKKSYELLLSDMNYLSVKLETMEKKYYSTKEGKKEMKKKK